MVRDETISLFFICVVIVLQARLHSTQLNPLLRGHLLFRAGLLPCVSNFSPAWISLLRGEGGGEGGKGGGGREEVAMATQADRAHGLWTPPQKLQLPCSVSGSLCPSSPCPLLFNVCRGADWQKSVVTPAISFYFCLWFYTELATCTSSCQLGELSFPPPWSQGKVHMQPLPSVWFSAKTLRSKTVFCSEWGTPSALWM